MYRHKKSEDENDPKTEVLEKSEDEMEDKTATSTKPEIRTSPKPIVSSTLSPIKEQTSTNKPLAMLLQIFPGKPQKILEAKLREAKGDVVKALELCAKHFDAPTEPPQKRQKSTAAAILENNNVSTSEPVAKFFPPPLMAAALHKSAFVPAPTTNPQNPPTNFYRGFEPPNFFAKELFPFPPPLFPPSFFVGFSSNPSAYHHAAAASALNPPSFSLPDHHQSCVRPCVDPLCGQCAPKVDSTAEEPAASAARDSANEDL